MTGARFVVGIDLGTTHSAMAAALLERPKLHLLPIPQLVAPGEVSERDLLPSFLYLPSPGEFTGEELSLPWGADQYPVGEFARRQGAKSPHRLVASAKSWVCHGGVNRRAAILPWGAPDSEPHVSPYEAQVSYLRHLRRVWEMRHGDARLAEQDVVVTVPASFDEGARTLTSQAAEEAGLGQVRLLEEPQAAFYDYLGALSEESTSELKQQLAGAKLILVVDIGGGTTDLTLLRVLPESDGELPHIERIAVGGHLMLGGDNMDAALAMHALGRAGIPRPDDATQWSAIVQSARAAKERLLAADAPPEAVISHQGRGSRLIGNTKSLVVRRDEAAEVLLDGFFPHTDPAEVAARTARAGLTSLGLPFAHDVAVPRHVSTFLRRHAQAAREAGAEVQDGLPRPDLLLLNGGVFNAPAAIARFGEVLSRWYGGKPVARLEHTSLDTAVARGAVRSGLARHGLGAAIGGGTAKAYYLGLEQAGARRALCVAPRNVDEGTRIPVPERLFHLVLNEPVSFPLYSYAGERADPPGTLVDVDDELDPLPPLRTLLRGRTTARGREEELPVTVESRLDEAGGLHLGLVSLELPPRRWKLEFVLRGAESKKEQSGGPTAESHGVAGSTSPHDRPAEEPAAGSEPAHPKTAAAVRLVERSLSSSDEQKAKDARRDLEELLGARGTWSAATCRALFDALLAEASCRQLGVVHELNWLRLVSWTARPGFGFPQDPRRLDALWTLREEGPPPTSKGNWAEWWILWRRVAAGLNAERQQALYEGVRPWLWRKGKPPAGPQPHGLVEMMKMLASLERLSPEAKTTAGQLFVERAHKLGSWWALGRVGARSPLHGDAAGVVPPQVARKWLQKLLELDWAKAEGAAFAAASIARLTGDPQRDIQEELRKRVAKRLTEVDANPTWIDMVLRNTEWEQGDLGRMLGDALPAGLRLS